MDEGDPRFTTQTMVSTREDEKRRAAPCLPCTKMRVAYEPQTAPTAPAMGGDVRKVPGYSQSPGYDHPSRAKNKSPY